MTNLKDMAAFEHRGQTYYENDEHIYNGDGVLLGWVSSRGAQYAWCALDSEGNEWRRGFGVYSPDMEADPAIDALIGAHRSLP